MIRRERGKHLKLPIDIRRLLFDQKTSSFELCVSRLTHHSIVEHYVAKYLRQIESLWRISAHFHPTDFAGIQAPELAVFDPCKEYFGVYCITVGWLDVLVARIRLVKAFLVPDEALCLC